ncbi:MAG: endolytic transglycosylase MltG [Herbinix sp.]|nr:endolytic transglycosylase MltG [Herbinix sp.]
MATKSTTLKLTLKVTGFVTRLLLNIIFYILVIILIVNVSKLAYNFTYQLYGPVTVEQAPGTDIIFQVKEGESTMDIASKLELNLAITNKYAFYLKAKLQKSVIMPGTYKLNSSMTYDDIITVITDYSNSIIKDDTKTGTKTSTDSGSSAATNTNTD